MEHETFGRYVRKHRRATDITLAELADAIGMTPNYLSQIERNIRMLSPDHFAKLAKALPSIEVKRLWKLWHGGQCPTCQRDT